MPKPVILPKKRDTPWEPPHGRAPRNNEPYPYERELRFHNIPCTLPDAVFDDNGRVVKRERGLWYVEKWPTLTPGEMHQVKDDRDVALYDMRVEVLAGRPIPAGIVEHPWLKLRDMIWAPDRYRAIGAYETYLYREDGEYVKSGSEYVFKAHSARRLVFKPVMPTLARLRE